ncbi:hypothetical protein ABZ934_02765 [Streptomyces sp. NPDC046557]|uniref:hypothetical protein n=1 Tax=Streptomyces sp. NPDC046557 TaxID=3155372 RepID=UPI0033D56577
MDGAGNGVDALGRAAAAERAALRGSDWYARYLAVFGGSQLLVVPSALLWHGRVAAAVFTVAQVLLVGGLSVYAVRQRVVRRGFGVRHGLIIGTWGVFFAATLIVGLTVFPGSAAFAAVGAVACALPPTVGVRLELRRQS